MNFEKEGNYFNFEILRIQKVQRNDRKLTRVSMKPLEVGSRILDQAS